MVLDFVAFAISRTRAQSFGRRLPFPAIVGLRRGDRPGWPVLSCDLPDGPPGALCFPLMRGEIRGEVLEAYSYE
jgi:hypothetical protein